MKFVENKININIVLRYHLFFISLSLNFSQIINFYYQTLLDMSRIKIRRIEKTSLFLNNVKFKIICIV